MASADGMTLKTMVMNFLESKTQAEVESMTIKAVRRGVSEMFSLTLDDKQKRKVQQYIMEFFEKQEVKVTSAQAVPSRKKKASEISAVAAVGDAEAEGATVVVATVDPDGEPAKKAMKSEPTCWVRTSSGAVAPKFLKKAQARAMKTKTFLANAGDLEVDVFGNTVGGVPRVFSSGNKGWYCGGKILIKIGKKKLWAHCGLNITILGSKDWKD